MKKGKCKLAQFNSTKKQTSKHVPTCKLESTSTNLLKEALQSWGLREEHQVCVTTDNATNNIRTLQLNDWSRLQCFGHRLHLDIGKCVIKLHL